MNRLSGIVLAALLAAVLVLPNSGAFGNNNFFLPGDAFFYSEPSHQWFESLPIRDDIQVQYQRPRQQGGRLCGYAGYKNLQLENMSPEMRANIVNAYRALRTRYPQKVNVYQEKQLRMEHGRTVLDDNSDAERHESNLVSMVIYNRDFDLARFQPLFRYNEGWADAAAEFGHARDSVAYDFFVGNASSIEKDWRDSPLVSPLKVSVPEWPVGVGKRRHSKTPIRIDCENVQILLFPTAFYEDIAFPESDFEYQDLSGRRIDQLSRQARSGGVFSVQESDGGSENSWQAIESENVEVQDLEVPFFGYLATATEARILKPERKRWVVSDAIHQHSIVPVDRADQKWWSDRHVQKLESAKTAGDASVLLVGDSITHSWESHLKVWDEVMPKRKAFNIGFSGDRTEHVLWRLKQGALEGLDPMYVVLMIGTNNTGFRMDPPADVAIGIQAIVDELKMQLPNATVLLFGVFPRGKDDRDARRRNNALINELVSKFGIQDRVNYIDIGNGFFTPEGELANGITNDFLHLNAAGYKIWAEAIYNELFKLENTLLDD